jgi:hypothetical protein
MLMTTSDTSAGPDGGIEYFGKYTHTIHFRTLGDVDRCLAAILEILGEGVEDLPAARDGEQESYSVELVTNAPVDEGQIAVIQEIEGIVSCSWNEDMQESGVLAY